MSGFEIVWIIITILSVIISGFIIFIDIIYNKIKDYIYRKKVKK